MLIKPFIECPFEVIQKLSTIGLLVGRASVSFDDTLQIGLLELFVSCNACQRFIEATFVRPDIHQLI